MGRRLRTGNILNMAQSLKEALMSKEIKITDACIADCCLPPDLFLMQNGAAYTIDSRRSDAAYQLCTAPRYWCVPALLPRES
jgi:hypothetical protein